IVNLVVTVIGAIIGTSWAFALKSNVLDGLLYGSIIGLAFGILIYFFLKATAGSSYEKRSFFLTVSVLAFVLTVGIGSALIALILRLAFF
ncbi:MAG TPA: hypothetical protein VK588_16400, partial [Chitinophagaceae bacterium]|nr:hypothetical protein [Chitinophagaceae bacterium]